jgi:hypothetical protein
VRLRGGDLGMSMRILRSEGDSYETENSGSPVDWLLGGGDE